MRMNRRKLLGASAGAVAAGAAGLKLLRGFAGDPGADFAALPESLRRTALDVHVHILGVGTQSSGCWMSEAMRGSLQARAGLWNLGLRLGHTDLDARYVEYLRTRLHAAGFLKQAVILAQDFVYSEIGEKQPDHTPFYTPNDYVATLARQHSEFLFGASIHPYRPDALEELERAAALGAVLVKWIPNVQAIDLTHARCRRFYRRLAERKIALLAHVGDEQAMFIAGQEFGDPRRLVAPLEEGVTVIAAHAASLGEREGAHNFEHLAALFPRWPNLYADTSALTLITRWRKLIELAERVDVHGRLVHGSDFPLPPAATMYVGRIPAGAWWNAWKRENIFRRDFEIKQALHLPEEIYTRGYQVLAPRLAAIRPT
jgi:predicted TIM-barrel fold metal-dependent hydrolase